jgi:hypothetical protein
MKITKLSNNFTPIREGIFFGINTESSSPEDLTVEVVESDSGKVVATQQVRSVTSAKVNIAPYLLHAIEHKPSSQHHTSMVDAPTTTFHIRIGEVESERVTVSVNSHPFTASSIISPMPPVRRMAYGEQDEVLVCCPTDALITAQITSDKGEEVTIEYVTNSGITTLLISTEDFDHSTRRLSVELLCNGEAFGGLNYTITPTSSLATRLVWLSELGSIERYSFPVTRKSCRTISKKVVRTEDALTTVRSTTRVVDTLTSRYEPRATIEALMQAASATKVWVESEGSLYEVEVCNSSIEHNLFNAPDILFLEVCRYQKEVAVW